MLLNWNYLFNTFVINKDIFFYGILWTIFSFSILVLKSSLNSKHIYSTQVDGYWSLPQLCRNYSLPHEGKEKVMGKQLLRKHEDLKYAYGNRIQSFVIFAVKVLCVETSCPTCICSETLAYFENWRQLLSGCKRKISRKHLTLVYSIVPNF